MDKRENGYENVIEASTMTWTAALEYGINLGQWKFD